MEKIKCKECGKEYSVLDVHFKTGDNSCEGCKLVLKRLYFEDRWNNGGSFMHNLCEAIVKADKENLRKLYLAFPELVEGYLIYSQGLTWEQFNEGTNRSSI